MRKASRQKINKRGAQDEQNLREAVQKEKKSETRKMKLIKGLKKRRTVENTE